MIRVTPAKRISLGLVLLTVNILVVAEMIGLVPDPTAAILDARKKICESLAIQFSAAANAGDVYLIETTLRAVVERNPDIVSAAVRNSAGTLLSNAGEHGEYWTLAEGDKSTPSNVRVPVFRGNDRWGTVELGFSKLWPSAIAAFLGNTLLRLIAFVSLVGFAVYLLFLRRSLQELNPSSVVPERVKAAFEVLAEGVLILDEKERIVLANSSFADKIGSSPDELLGKRVEQLDWATPDAAPPSFPWTGMRDDKEQMGVALSLRTAVNGVRKFMVNGAPITDSKGHRRGALATFDDMTVLEEKNDELEVTLEKLREQKLKLQKLATRDPLTDCFNRRSFFEHLKAAFTRARKTGEPFSCMMIDIDHFKLINDRYGHGVGDQTIKSVADVLKAGARDTDVVGRYGGEEFCMMLPGTDVSVAADIAEMLRATLEEQVPAKVALLPALTASFGVAELSDDVGQEDDLLNRADRALYAAKESGRNRVIRWIDIPDAERAQNGPAKDEEDKAEVPVLSVPHRIVPAATAKTEVHRLRQQIKALETRLEGYAGDPVQQPGHDRVTGLPSRLLFFDRIEQAVARARRTDSLVAVLSVDLDMFKRVNDTLGPAVGNELLKQVAGRLRKLLRRSDTIGVPNEDLRTVSRLSGDEFGVLLTDLANVEAVTHVVQRLLNELGKPIAIGEHELYVSSTIGISLFPSDGQSAGTLLKKASAAREHAKRTTGHAHHQFYAEEINEVSLRRMQVENELRRAIQNGDFVLHFQPKVELKTGRISGMEALVRWVHAERGIVPPGDFIGIAERTGLIEQLGWWVIRSACSQLREWMEAGLPHPEVSVNLSAIQLRKGDLISRVSAVLEEYGVPPQCLEFEITESAVMENVESAIATMNAMRDAGMKIAIDDFGTGYSSLSYLKQLPADSLKIDRSFLLEVSTDSFDATIVSSIGAMAHSRGLRIVAEGVETPEQLQVLEACDCDEIQGYLFSRPLPAAEATSLLLKSHEFALAQSYNGVPKTGELIAQYAAFIPSGGS